MKRMLMEKANHIYPPAGLKQKVLEEIMLVNKKGEMLAKVTVDTLNIDNPFDQIINSLKPGTGKAIYIVHDNPDKMISNQTNYEKEIWHEGIEELQEKIKPYVFKTPLDSELKASYVMYGFDSLTEIELAEMVEEAEYTGENVIVRDLKKSDRMVGAAFVYEKEGIEFELHILTTTKNRIHVPDINDHLIETILVGEKEGIYLSDGKQHQLIWVTDDNGNNIQYEVRAFEVSKMWVCAIADSLMEIQ
ncbi:hypothetical protein AB4Z45_20315 [Paenibacillus sp. MCAF9]|uniref:hypothetical protein n=1 Tax=Paenibacillus sp. MCAF9 TaxID=3233046 RepID=UPI003F9E6728